MISSIKIPHSGPINAEVLIIGEAPGSDETRLKQPFVGRSGQQLREVLSTNGFHCASSEECEEDGINANSAFKIRFANLCNYQPLSKATGKSEFQALEDSPELKEGVREIKEYIKQNNNLKLIILTGNYPLQYLLGKYGISKWRGSVVDYEGKTYISTYHPSFILRARSEYPIFSFDISKAFKIYKSGYRKPSYNFTINPSPFQLEEIINELAQAKQIAVDIETVKNTNRILCIGFAPSKQRAVCIVNKSDEGLDPELRRACERILSESDNEKIFHNGIFDCEILNNNHIKVSNFKHDTMIMQHVLAPEMEKGLDFITSIYTAIPYYKDKGRAALPDNEKGWGRIKDEDKINIWEYNCLDCCATYWCAEEMLSEIIADDEFKHIYEYEMSMHDVAFHLMRSGMLIDEERRIELKTIIEERYVEEQRLLNAIVGKYINVGSPKQKVELLYKIWGLPERTGKTSNVTADEDAIVSLISYTKDYLSGLKKESIKYEWQKKLAGLITILKLQGYRKLLGSYIEVEKHYDSRVRSVYKITGTETGRWSCAKYFDDTGWNAQTLPRESI